MASARAADVAGYLHQADAALAAKPHSKSTDSSLLPCLRCQLPGPVPSGARHRPGVVATATDASRSAAHGARGRPAITWFDPLNLPSRRWCLEADPPTARHRARLAASGMPMFAGALDCDPRPLDGTGTRRCLAWRRDTVQVCGRLSGCLAVNCIAEA